MGRRYLLDHELLGLGLTGDAALYLGSDGQPVNAMHGGFGKWGRTGTPFTGWDWARDPNGFRIVECVGVDDGDLTQRPLCQMCEKSRHVWVHVMVHPDYPDRLEVGRCCAGHMANDMGAARLAETEAKFAAKASAGAIWTGDDICQRANIGRFWMTVRRFGSAIYRCELWHSVTRYRRQASQPYTTMEAAKRAVVRGVVKSRMTGSWKRGAA